jgi:hypothetical protein
MPRKKFPQPPGGTAARQSAALQQLLCELASPDAGTRAAAVRELCPCRTAWDVPVQRYVAAMMDDPSPSVRHEAHHVLDEDSGWGKRLAARRLIADLKGSPTNGEEPGPHSLAWRRRNRPRTKGAAARLAWSPRRRP